jgi:uncharacterized protein
MSYHQPVLPRSAGSIPVRRIPQSWPPDRDFRILSIDGGGIRGIFPAAVLADLEAALGTGNSIVDHFDLVARTSTGGISAKCSCSRPGTIAITNRIGGVGW